jgi:hypothetical protein
MRTKSRARYDEEEATENCDDDTHGCVLLADVLDKDKLVLVRGDTFHNDRVSTYVAGKLHQMA